MSPFRFVAEIGRQTWRMFNKVWRFTKQETVKPTAPGAPSPAVATTSSTLNFNEALNRIHSLLKTYEGTSPEVLEAFNSLRVEFPRPAAEIVDKNVWKSDSDILVVKTHLHDNFQNSVDNVRKIHANYSEEDEHYLRLVLTHWCGWSATDTKHSRDSWMQYLRAEYPHLHNLQPILDSLTWAEELPEYPIGAVPIRPWLFLLATDMLFYIYDFESSSLCCAGSCVRDVYEGLKNRRFQYWREGAWRAEEPSIEDDPGDYFPYYIRMPAGTFSLFRSVKDYVEESHISLSND